MPRGFIHAFPHLNRRWGNSCSGSGPSPWRPVRRAPSTSGWPWRNTRSALATPILSFAAIASRVTPASAGRANQGQARRVEPLGFAFQKFSKPDRHRPRIRVSHVPTFSLDANVRNLRTGDVSNRRILFSNESRAEASSGSRRSRDACVLCALVRRLMG